MTVRTNWLRSRPSRYRRAHLARLLDRLVWQCGPPRVIRTDNGKEFLSEALLT